MAVDDEPLGAAAFGPPPPPPEVAAECSAVDAIVVVDDDSKFRDEEDAELEAMLLPTLSAAKSDFLKLFFSLAIVS